MRKKKVKRAIWMAPTLKKYIRVPTIWTLGPGSNRLTERIHLEPDLQPCILWYGAPNCHNNPTLFVMQYFLFSWTTTWWQAHDSSTGRSSLSNTSWRYARRVLDTSLFSSRVRNYFFSRVRKQISTLFVRSRRAFSAASTWAVFCRSVFHLEKSHWAEFLNKVVDTTCWNNNIWG
jgi:hypothetical protein